MCIGIPMQVLQTGPGHALVHGRGDTRQVNTHLVGSVAPGQWLLVFINDAREIISAQRASEVNSTLDMVLSAMGGSGTACTDDPGFALPSAMDVTALRQLTQASS